MNTPVLSSSIRYGLVTVKFKVAERVRLKTNACHACHAWMCVMYRLHCRGPGIQTHQLYLTFL